MKIKITSILALLLCLVVQLSQAQDPLRFEESIRLFELEDENAWPGTGNVLFTGSSSIRMWKDIGNYFPERTIINRGFGGSEFSDLIYYADRIIYPYEPSKIFIYEGDNDLSAGESPEAVLEEAVRLREEIRQELPNAVVVFISAKPSLSTWGRKAKYEKFNSALKEYAAKTESTEYADVWSPMLNAEGKPEPSLFLGDGLHMKPSGYKVWQSVLLPFVKD